MESVRTGRGEPTYRKDRRGGGWRRLAWRGGAWREGRVPHLGCLFGSGWLCLFFPQNRSYVAETLEEFVGVGTHRDTRGV